MIKWINQKINSVLSYGYVKQFFSMVEKNESTGMVQRLISQTYGDRTNSILDDIENAVIYDNIQSIGMYIAVPNKNKEGMYPVLITVPVREVDGTVMYAKLPSVHLPLQSIDSPTDELQLRENLLSSKVFPLPVTEDVLTTVPYWYIMSVVRESASRARHSKWIGGE